MELYSPGSEAFLALSAPAGEGSSWGVYSFKFLTKCDGNHP